MFPNWLQLRRRRHEISPDSPKWPSHFSCSSFKDIHDLLYNEDPSLESDSPRCQILHQPRSPRIHRVVDIPNADHGGVVLYFTSLGIIRKTFDDCRSVRSILHKFRIPIDERDMSMDSRFHDELHSIFGTKKVTLPKVFIGGRYIGGAEEIKHLQESEELKKMISALALPPLDSKFSHVCDRCGGIRFVFCDQCNNGSHKIFSEKSGFTRCLACNAQGLIRCSLCFPIHRRWNSICSGGVTSKN